MRIPGVGGSALMVSSLAQGPERALRKREMKDQRQAQAIRLGLQGVNVLGDLGTDIYAIRSRNKNEAAEHALRQALQEKGQTFLREQAGYEHGLGAPERERQYGLQRDKLAQDAALAREGMQSDERQATIRGQGDEWSRIALASLLGRADKAGGAPLAPGEPPLDASTMTKEQFLRATAAREPRARIQEQLFGQERRLDPSFYSDMAREPSFWQGTGGSQLRNELIATLARLKKENVPQQDLDAALAALRGSDLHAQATTPTAGAPIGPLQTLRMIIDDKALTGGRIGDTTELESRLLQLLQPGSGQSLEGPLSPEEQERLRAFYQRRAATRR